MKTALILTIATLAFTGLLAAAAPQVVSTSNPATGGASIGVKKNYVPHTGGPSVSEIQINPMKLVISSGPEYALQIVFVGNAWMFIGNTIPLNIDSRVSYLKATPAMGNRNVNQDASVVETLVCLVKRSEIEKIARGSKVTMQLSGRNGNAFLTFTPANIAAFRDFLAKS